MVIVQIGIIMHVEHCKIIPKQPHVSGNIR
jgi:hypothetical protein